MAPKRKPHTEADSRSDSGSLHPTAKNAKSEKEEAQQVRILRLQKVVPTLKSDRLSTIKVNWFALFAPPLQQLRYGRLQKLTHEIGSSRVDHFA